jgi:hypothetical protein
MLGQTRESLVTVEAHLVLFQAADFVEYLICIIYDGYMTARLCCEIRILTVFLVKTFLFNASLDFCVCRNCVDPVRIRVP